jgi:hypothetical protein
MKYITIALLLIVMAFLIIGDADARRSGGRIYSRGTGTVTPPAPPAGTPITINGADLTINGTTVDAH